MSVTPSDTDSLRDLISTKLNRVCEDLYGGIGARMAEELDVSQSKMSRLLQGQQKTIDAYLDIASRLAERHSQISIEAFTRPEPEGAPEQEQIRMYKDVKAGAVNGIRPVSEWHWHPVKLPVEIMRSLVPDRTAPENIGIIQAGGESMYPEVRSGDWILFTPTETITDGASSLVRMDDALLLRIIQWKAGQRLRIHSLNSEFEDDYIRKKESGEWVTEEEHIVDFDVVGRFLNVIQSKDLYAASQRAHDILTAYHAVQNGEL